MSEPAKAIFLSYASQDADAARRLCDVLREAGLEVWFDQSELRGGDAWDASIRKQVKECALFVPIISANTDARSEGYFRREWNLAVLRMLDMAEEQAFLLPVVIDDTQEATAQVPERFRERQWSRVWDAESAKAFAARALQLGSGKVRWDSTPETGRGFSKKSRPVKAVIASLAGAAFVLAGVGWYWHTSQVAKVSPITSTGPPAAHRSALSIMVLPFANGTGDPQQAYIADGLTASVTSDLSRIRDAFVVAAATAIAYKDKPVTLQQLGKDVGVRFVLQGNVQRSGNRIRINAQLADASSNAQLWSEKFDGDQSDLFTLQDHVTMRIANTIGREMVIVAAREIDTRKSSPKVADLMLRAAAVGLKPQSVNKFGEMASLYRQVLALEPNHPRALVGLSTSLALHAANFSQAMDESVREKMLLEARDLALKAREIDPEDPGVYVAIGAFARSHGDLAGARRAAETRLSLDPKSVAAHNNLAGLFLDGSEEGSKKAIELLIKAINLDPKHPTTDAGMVNMGIAYFMLGDNDAAIDWYLRSLERNAAFPNTYAYLAMAYALKGDEARARVMVADLRRVDPNYRLEHERRMASNSAVPKDWFEKKIIPAWRKARLPE